MIEPIKAVLPPCIVAKRGRKGETLFFRGDTSAIRSRGFKRQRPGSADPRAREGMMDLIADGKQTVVPPSIHPDTAAPYVWTTERTLRDTPPGDLTDITVEHVIEVLRAHGYEAPETIQPVEGRSDASFVDEPGLVLDSAQWYRKLNDDALANLHAWVPRLNLTRLQRSGDGYRSVAEWRPSTTGKPLHKRNLYLSIDPKGIVDYGDCEKGYTALNLVMAALGILDSDLDRAVRWLGEAIGYDFSPVLLNRKRPKLSPRDEAARLYSMAQEADETAPAPVAAAEPVAPVTDVPSAPAMPVDEPPLAATSATVIEFPEVDDAPPPRSHEEEMRDLVEGVPGLVGDLVEWMRITSDTPNPILSFAASVPFVGALAGRNYEAPAKQARTNLYTIGLAPSGFGKDHARQCIKHILAAANLDRYLGAARIMSSSALRRRIEQNPSTFYMIDEFGGFMRDINNMLALARAEIARRQASASGDQEGSWRLADEGRVQCSRIMPIVRSHAAKGLALVGGGVRLTVDPGTPLCAENFCSIYYVRQLILVSRAGILLTNSEGCAVSLQLNPLHLKVNSLLNGRLFRIPDYQRAYSWTPKQRSDLFADIREVHRTGREHFMATVVALARGTKTIAADEFRQVELVDGQQRVTTIIILLKAIEKSLAPREPTQARIQREMQELLVKSDEHSLILLQTNHDSSSIFARYIRDGIIDDNSVVTAADNNIVAAAKECEKFVSEWQETSSLVDLTSVIRNKLSLIYHEISDEATVYRVFEVLNSRGLDVKWVDKLKSQLMALIFEYVEEDSRLDALNEMRSSWQKIYRKLGLESRLGDEALRFCGTWSLGELPKRILSEENAAEALTKKAGIQIKSILRVSDYLVNVVNAVSDLDSDVRIKAVTRIVHARFVAVSIKLRNFPAAQEATLIARWEKVTFRIFGLAGADTRHKVGEYVRLGYNILKGDMSYEQVLNSIDKLGQDYDLQKKFEDPDYWSDSYNGWGDQLRYIMYRYDEYLAKESNEGINAVQWSKIWAEDISKSIEHIMPQSSGGDYVHHLGNLTMLPPGINSKLKDKPPREKAETYRKVGLRATADVGHDIPNMVKWDKRAILARAKKIEIFILQEWG